jgi:hypothetical protein
MYTSLPAVVAKYIANSWDVGASKVEVQVPKGLPTGSYAITIKDDSLMET